MNAPTNASSEVVLEYNDCYWGELIHGTKEELQRLGLGVGMDFPGEPGAPKRSFRVRDPRGFVTVIEKDWNGFFARILFHKNATDHLYDFPEDIREMVIKRLWALPRPPKLTARSGTLAQHAHDYPNDGAYLAFRKNLLRRNPQ